MFWSKNEPNKHIYLHMYSSCFCVLSNFWLVRSSFCLAAKKCQCSTTYRCTQLIIVSLFCGHVAQIEPRTGNPRTGNLRAGKPYLISILISCREWFTMATAAGGLGASLLPTSGGTKASSTRIRQRPCLRIVLGIKLCHGFENLAKNIFLSFRSSNIVIFALIPRTTPSTFFSRR